MDNSVADKARLVLLLPKAGRALENPALLLLLPLLLLPPFPPPTAAAAGPPSIRGVTEAAAAAAEDPAPVEGGGVVVPLSLLLLSPLALIYGKCGANTQERSIKSSNHTACLDPFRTC